MMSTQTRIPKISSAQMVTLLVLARLFILLIFIPSTHKSVVGTASLLSVVLGYLLTIVALLPAYFLIRKNPNMNLHEIASQTSPTMGKVAAVGFYLTCMAVTVETVTQFNIFLTDAVYPRASQLGVEIIFCAAVLYIAFLGLEALSRASSVILILSIAASALIGFGLWKFFDTLNIISPFYDGISVVIQGSTMYFTQNVELIAFALLLSNLNSTTAKKTFLKYHTLISVMLIAVGFASIIVLGNYAGTRNFPIYTMFVLSGSNVFYRFDYILIAIWVGTAMMRSALYLILSSRMLNELTGRHFGKKLIVVNTIFVLILSMMSLENIKLFVSIYRFLASGIPVYFLVLLLPLTLMLIQWKKSKQEQTEQSSKGEQE